MIKMFSTLNVIRFIGSFNAVATFPSHHSIFNESTTNYKVHYIFIQPANSNYSYPPCTVADEETKAEMISHELQVSQKERQEIVAFESHLAAASTKLTITESSSLLLCQLTSLAPK